MGSPDALPALATSRRSFHECLRRRRTDALFELTDAPLTADGAAPSPVHLTASERRIAAAGVASLRRAPARADRRRSPARVLRSPAIRSPRERNDARLRRGGRASVWDRCDAQSSSPPARGYYYYYYYYHPSRHSAPASRSAGRMGLPVRRRELNYFVRARERWTAPVGVSRVRPMRRTPTWWSPSSG